MATKQLIKYSGKNYGDKYEIKNAVFSIKTAKTYSDLEQALTINFISQLDVYDDTVAEQFSRFKRGYLQRALGQGIRYVETFGLLQTKKFSPAQPGTTVCLEIPNNTMERAEVIGRPTRVYCSSKLPDFMDAYELFVDPAELFEFTSNKIGNIKRSISVFLDITFQYILSIDPWGGEHADHFNAFTIGSILGAKWDDTIIGNFGSDKEGVGAILKDLNEDLKDEIDKEAKLPNVHEYNVWDWLPKFPVSPYPQQIKANWNEFVKKGKKPTAAIDLSNKKNFYYSIKDSDPGLCAAAVAKCLSYHVEMMIGETTAQNDSQFPGNIEDKAADYGKEKTTATRDNKGKVTKGATKGDHTKSMFLPTKINRDELVIIMNSDLYKEIKSASMISEYTESGSCNSYIKSFMQYDANIVKLDTMPYGAFKIGSKLRYNLWDLYDKVGTDEMKQADVVVHTAHRGLVFGIREYRPFKYIRLHGLYVNPTVYDQNIKFEAAKDIS